MWQVSANGVWCDTLRVDGDEAILVSFFGPRNATRAVWARSMRGDLVDAGRGRRKRRYGLIGFADPDCTDMLATACYSTDNALSIQAPNPTQEVPDNLHIVLINADATNRANPYGKQFYAVGDEGATMPSVGSWWGRWNAAFDVPAAPEWAPELFTEGLQDGLVVELSGYGRPVWKFQRNGSTNDCWAAIIKTLVTSKRKVAA